MLRRKPRIHTPQLRNVQQGTHKPSSISLRMLNGTWNGTRFCCSGSSRSDGSWIQDFRHPSTKTIIIRLPNLSSSGVPRRVRVTWAEQRLPRSSAKSGSQKPSRRNGRLGPRSAKLQNSRLPSRTWTPYPRAAFHRHRSVERQSLDVPRKRGRSAQFVRRGCPRQTGSRMPARNRCQGHNSLAPGRPDLQAEHDLSGGWPHSDRSLHVRMS